MSAYYEHTNRNTRLSLYFEDDTIALNLGKVDPFTSEEILLTVDAIQPLIDALTQMRAAIKENPVQG